MIWKPCIPLLVLAGLAASAIADEVWSTPVGEAVYEADLATGEAVISFPGESGQRLLGIFPGLAGITKGRGFFEGAWLDPEGAEEGTACPVAVVDPLNGGTTYAWGRLDLIFTEPDYPGGWVVLKGTCFESPTDYLIGTPVME